MKEDTARTVANVVLGAAAIGVAVVVFRVPTLRRLALTFARTALAGALPWITSEIQQAWAESGRDRTLPPAPGSRTSEF